MTPGPSPTPGPAATSTPPEKVAAAVRWQHSVKKAFTTFISMTISGISAGAKVELRCVRPKGAKGKCPFAKKNVTVKRGSASATSVLKRKRFGVGVNLEVRVTKPGAIGKVLRLTIRASKAPKDSQLCMAPGASGPGRC